MSRNLNGRFILMKRTTYVSKCIATSFDEDAYILYVNKIRMIQNNFG
jgi:hypothetical protein